MGGAVEPEVGGKGEEEGPGGVLGSGYGEWAGPWTGVSDGRR